MSYERALTPERMLASVGGMEAALRAIRRKR
jgi:hypothetical protein